MEFCSAPRRAPYAPSPSIPNTSVPRSAFLPCSTLGARTCFIIPTCIVWPLVEVSLRRAWPGFHAKLEFFSSLESLRDRCAFLDHLAPTREAEWVVYAKRPFAGPEQVLDYVGRYIHRVAISNNRLLDIGDGKLTFRYKDYRHEGQRKTMTLQAEEFIRRFLLHVLPEGFQRIRYYGFLANRYREQKIACCRKLLGMPALEPPALEAAKKDYHERYEELTGCSLWECPVCHQGRMLVVKVLPRNPHRHVTPAIKDTS
jgi:Putative transposase